MRKVRGQARFTGAPQAQEQKTAEDRVLITPDVSGVRARGTRGASRRSLERDIHGFGILAP